jgi:hypothetical protein
VQRYGEPKPNNPREEFPDLIDWTALPPDHLLIPPKIFHVQPEQNSPLRGNPHLPGGPQIVLLRGSSIHTHGPHKPCPYRDPKPLCPVVRNKFPAGPRNKPPVAPVAPVMPPVTPPVAPASSGTVIKASADPTTGAL